jgi:stearoyl-CoA desaturase (delta-9 desaturase)
MVGLVALALGGYVVRMWALTAGYHRYFSHRSYKTSRVFHTVLAVLGSTAMQNGPIWWASWHRRHHKFTDRPGDPHSPKLGGLWHAHVGWIFDGKHSHPDFENVNDLTALPELRFVERFNKAFVVLWAPACWAIGGVAGVVWGFVVSTVLLAHFTFFINSLAHVWGSRRYATADTSRNNPLLAVLMLGEGWHNNHHHYMSSARQGFFWWELDFSYATLVVLSWLRVIWDVRQPTELALRSDLVTPSHDSDPHGSAPAAHS